MTYWHPNSDILTSQINQIYDYSIESIKLKSCRNFYSNLTSKLGQNKT